MSVKCLATGWMSRVQFLAEARIFSVHQRFQNRSYPISIRDSLRGDKAERPWSWWLTSI